jgi:1,4-alpha-glucan branching enzyme
VTAQFQIVLHAHLPFVRHPENPFHLEEMWFFEAVSETYLPILQFLTRLANDGIASPLTISISQPLAAMMDDRLLRERFVAHLQRLVKLGQIEIERTRGTEFADISQFYLVRFQQQLELFEQLRRDVLGAFIEHHRTGRIELITCVGTHGFLPLMLTDESRRAQIRTAVTQFTRRVGTPPRGMWMGECAYWWGVDQMLADVGVAYSFVEDRAILRASHHSNAGVALPVISSTGVLFFSRDPESSHQVWSASEGYPGDPAYRDFYRDLGFDLPVETILPWIHPDGIRIHTGFKYHRVTASQGDHKEPYLRDVAMLRVRAHAEHFVTARLQQLNELEHRVGPDTIITSPYDAELFGHWWFEGPEFLEQVFRVLAERGESLRVTTPTAWSSQAERSIPIAEPAPSSWGENADYSVWLNEETGWIYPMLRHAEETMVRLAGEADSFPALHQRVLRQAARELMLAQASDWAFIIHNRTAAQYAAQQTRAHLDAFWALVHGLQNLSDADALTSLVCHWELRHPIFPALELNDWAPR